MQAPAPWQVVARNLPAHAGNPIHTDAGARAAGFAGALVAGVTVHAWLTHPPVEAWGDAWRDRGGGFVRFRRPVLDRELVTCRSTANDDGSLNVDALGGDDPEPRAVMVAHAPETVAPPEPFPVTPRHDRFPADATILSALDHLGSIDAALDGKWGATYAPEVGDDLPVYADGTQVHPGVWLEAAHLALTQNIGLPAWVHTASTYRLYGALVPVGTPVSVRSRVVEAQLRKGRDEIRCDVQIVAGGRVIVTVDHHAIIRMPS